MAQDVDVPIIRAYLEKHILQRGGKEVEQCWSAFSAITAKMSA